MSVLPSGQQLASVVPDLESLLEAPAEYLKAGAVRIGPRRMYGLAAAFALPGILLVVSFVVAINADPGREGHYLERLALGVGLLLGALVWLSWSLLLRGHELILYPEGVEVRYRGSVVWCPWALFNSGSTPHVPDTDSPLLGLTLPINPEAIPYVELRREDTPIAHGSQVKARQLVFVSPTEVMLPARYAVVAGQLGGLLLQLGQKLGRQLPRGTPPPEAFHEVESSQPAGLEPDEKGWITVHLNRLHFPWRCCNCGADTRNVLRQSVQARVDLLLGPFAFNSRYLTVQTPICESCEDQLREDIQRGGQRSLFGGIALGLALTVVIGFLLHTPLRDLAWWSLLGVTAGGVVGLLVGAGLSYRPPVQFRNYSPSRGTLQLRFRNPEQAKPFLEALRARSEQASRP
jgi:hypothetical protein